MLRIFAISVFIASFFSFRASACAKVAVAIGHAVDQDGTKLKTGQNLSKGTEIITGATSLVKLVLLDDSILDLGSSSRLRISACQGKNWETRINLEMKKGSIRALVNKDPKRKREAFELKTETSVLAVRGTEFFVSWQQNEQGQVVEKVGVSEGQVEVRSLFDDAMKPIALNTGTELLSQGLIEKVDGAIKVKATAEPRVDQFTADEQRQAEEKTKVENRVFENSVELSGETSSRREGGKRSDKIASFINGAMEKSQSRLREISSDEKADNSSAGNSESTSLADAGDPTSSGEAVGSVSVPGVNGAPVIAVPIVISWGISKEPAK